MKATASPRDRAIFLATETMGEIVSFWGFKASMGRIWTLLYLTARPLPADEIVTQTGMSAGSVSMSLTELERWGLVERAPTKSRKRHYRADTDIWSIIRRIIRERELRLIARSRSRFEEALSLLEAEHRAAPSPELEFTIGRMRRLLELSRLGYRLVETFAEAGRFTLEPIRGALGLAKGA